MRYEVTDKEWTAINPMLPNKRRGAPRVNDRGVLDGIPGPCDLGRDGATCRTTSARIRRATIVSLAGDELAFEPRL
jgi:transposase